MFNDTTAEEINQAMENSWAGFETHRTCTLKQRAALMRVIAEEIGKLGDELFEAAAEETFLPQARLRAELARTVFQWTSYAAACERGDWLEARIDRGSPERNPPKPDLRKTRVPLGPVVVFGAANFPFAYSTGGGDTASALAAGCTVVVKAHPAHPRSSELVASAIHRAVSTQLLPAGVFIHLHGASHEVGKTLVEHPFTKAVGFTGSQAGGRQLFDWACQRAEPIPLFAEMSSINPVFILPQGLATNREKWASDLASSITLGAGQFCTNPGLLIGIKNDALTQFSELLAASIRETEPVTMLNPGIFKNYVERRANALAQEPVEALAVAEKEAMFNQGVATLATVDASSFLQNRLLHQEVFGPYSLLVKCTDLDEMREVARQLEGQLTTTVLAGDDDLAQAGELLADIRERCGRLILNGVPTGVEVTAAMHHGGPYPATTDSRFTSVGEDAIKRFSRPLAFQNWPEQFLPDELKDENPMRIGRWVDSVYER